MPAVRVFAPQEDRVRELFAGPQHQHNASDRKVSDCYDQPLSEDLLCMLLIQLLPGVPAAIHAAA
jgi:hypothetical protein